MTITLPRALVLVAALFFAGCKTVPITMETIRGHYEMSGRPEGLWYSGESLVLGDGTFQYWLFTNQTDDPRLAQYPVSGRYTLQGNTITLHHSGVQFPQRTIRRVDRRFTLWTPRQLAIPPEPGRIPDDVLVQRR
jgi:hypothetical protein